MPNYLSSADTAVRWGVSHRRVALLCEQGRIPGAYKIGNGWAIPADAEKPPDQRIKSGKYIKDPSEWKKNKKAADEGGEREQTQIELLTTNEGLGDL